MTAFGIAVNEACVCVFKEGATKEESLNRLSEAVAGSGAVKDVESVRRALRDHEPGGSAIGRGVAIPHVFIEGVEQPAIAVGVSRAGIDFALPDHSLVTLIVLFVMPAGSNKQYLSLLAQLMVALKTPNFLSRLTACQAPPDVVAILNESSG